MARFRVVLLLALVAVCIGQDFECLDPEAEALLTVAAMRAVLPEAECLCSCASKWCELPTVAPPPSVVPVVTTASPVAIETPAPIVDAPVVTPAPIEGPVDPGIPCTDPLGCFGNGTTTTAHLETTPAPVRRELDFPDASEFIPGDTPVPGADRRQVVAPGDTTTFGGFAVDTTTFGGFAFSTTPIPMNGTGVALESPEIAMPTPGPGCSISPSVECPAVGKELAECMCSSCSATNSTILLLYMEEIKASSVHFRRCGFNCSLSPELLATANTVTGVTAGIVAGTVAGAVAGTVAGSVAGSSVPSPGASVYKLIGAAQFMNIFGKMLADDPEPLIPAAKRTPTARRLLEKNQARIRRRELGDVCVFSDDTGEDAIEGGTSTASAFSDAFGWANFNFEDLFNIKDLDSCASRALSKWWGTTGTFVTAVGSTFFTREVVDRFIRWIFTYVTQGEPMAQGGVNIGEYELHSVKAAHQGLSIAAGTVLTAAKNAPCPCEGGWMVDALMALGILFVLSFPIGFIIFLVVRLSASYKRGQIEYVTKEGCGSWGDYFAHIRSAKQDDKAHVHPGVTHFYIKLALGVAGALMTLLGFSEAMGADWTDASSWQGENIASIVLLIVGFLLSFVPFLLKKYGRGFLVGLTNLWAANVGKKFVYNSKDGTVETQDVPEQKGCLSPFIRLSSYLYTKIGAITDPKALGRLRMRGDWAKESAETKDKYGMFYRDYAKSGLLFGAFLLFKNFMIGIILTPDPPLVTKTARIWITWIMYLLEFLALLILMPDKDLLVGYGMAFQQLQQTFIMLIAALTANGSITSKVGNDIMIVFATIQVSLAIPEQLWGILKSTSLKGSIETDFPLDKKEMVRCLKLGVDDGAMEKLGKAKQAVLDLKDLIPMAKAGELIPVLSGVLSNRPLMQTMEMLKPGSIAPLFQELFKQDAIRDNCARIAEEIPILCEPLTELATLEWEDIQEVITGINAIETLVQTLTGVAEMAMSLKDGKMAEALGKFMSKPLFVELLNEKLDLLGVVKSVIKNGAVRQGIEEAKQQAVALIESGKVKNQKAQLFVEDAFDQLLNNPLNTPQDVMTIADAIADIQREIQRVIDVIVGEAEAAQQKAEKAAQKAENAAGRAQAAVGGGNFGHAGDAEWLAEEERSRLAVERAGMEAYERVLRESGILALPPPPGEEVEMTTLLGGLPGDARSVTVSGGNLGGDVSAASLKRFSGGLMIVAIQRIPPDAAIGVMSQLVEKLPEPLDQVMGKAMEAATLLQGIQEVVNTLKAGKYPEALEAIVGRKNFASALNKATSGAVQGFLRGLLDQKPVQDGAQRVKDLASRGGVNVAGEIQGLLDNPCGTPEDLEQALSHMESIKAKAPKRAADGANAIVQMLPLTKDQAVDLIKDRLSESLPPPILEKLEEVLGAAQELAAAAAGCRKVVDLIKAQRFQDAVGLFWSDPPFSKAMDRLSKGGVQKMLDAMLQTSLFKNALMKLKSECQQRGLDVSRPVDKLLSLTVDAPEKMTEALDAFKEIVRAKMDAVMALLPKDKDELLDLIKDKVLEEVPDQIKDMLETVMGQGQDILAAGQGVKRVVDNVKAQKYQDAVALFGTDIPFAKAMDRLSKGGVQKLIDAVLHHPLFEEGIKKVQDECQKRGADISKAVTTLKSLTVETPETLSQALDSLKDVVKAKQDAMMALLPKDKDELLDLIKDKVLEEVPDQIKDMLESVMGQAQDILAAGQGVKRVVDNVKAQKYQDAVALFGTDIPFAKAMDRLSKGGVQKLIDAVLHHPLFEEGIKKVQDECQKRGADISKAVTTLKSLTVETPETLSQALDSLKDVVKAKQDAMMALLPKDKDELLDLIKDKVLEEVPDQIKNMLESVMGQAQDILAAGQGVKRVVDNVKAQKYQDAVALFGTDIPFAKAMDRLSKGGVQKLLDAVLHHPLFEEGIKKVQDECQKRGADISKAVTTLKSLTVETPETLSQALDSLKDVVKAKQDAMMALLPKDKDELLDLIKDKVLEKVPDQIKNTLETVMGQAQDILAAGQGVKRVVDNVKAQKYQDAVALFGTDIDFAKAMDRLSKGGVQKLLDAVLHHPLFEEGIKKVQDECQKRGADISKAVTTLKSLTIDKPQKLSQALDSLKDVVKAKQDAMMQLLPKDKDELLDLIKDNVLVDVPEQIKKTFESVMAAGQDIANAMPNVKKMVDLLKVDKYKEAVALVVTNTAFAKALNRLSKGSVQRMMESIIGNQVFQTSINRVKDECKARGADVTNEVEKIKSLKKVETPQKLVEAVQTFEKMARAKSDAILALLPQSKEEVLDLIRDNILMRIPEQIRGAFESVLGKAQDIAVSARGCKKMVDLFKAKKEREAVASLLTDARTSRALDRLSQGKVQELFAKVLENKEAKSAVKKVKDEYKKRGAAMPAPIKEAVGVLEDAKVKGPEDLISAQKALETVAKTHASAITSMIPKDKEAAKDLVKETVMNGMPEELLGPLEEVVGKAKGAAGGRMAQMQGMAGKAGKMGAMLKKASEDDGPFSLPNILKKLFNVDMEQLMAPIDALVDAMPGPAQQLMGVAMQGMKMKAIADQHKERAMAGAPPKKAPVKKLSQAAKKAPLPAKAKTTGAMDQVAASTADRSRGGLQAASGAIGASDRAATAIAGVPKAAAHVAGNTIGSPSQVAGAGGIAAGGPSYPMAGSKGVAAGGPSYPMAGAGGGPSYPMAAAGASAPSVSNGLGYPTVPAVVPSPPAAVPANALKGGPSSPIAGMPTAESLVGSPSNAAVPDYSSLQQQAAQTVPSAPARRGSQSGGPSYPMAGAPAAPAAPAASSSSGPSYPIAGAPAAPSNPAAGGAGGPSYPMAGAPAAPAGAPAAPAASSSSGPSYPIAGAPAAPSNPAAGGRRGSGGPSYPMAGAPAAPAAPAASSSSGPSYPIAGAPAAPSNPAAGGRRGSGGPSYPMAGAPAAPAGAPAAPAASSSSGPSYPIAGAPAAPSNPAAGGAGGPSYPMAGAPAAPAAPAASSSSGPSYPIAGAPAASSSKGPAYPIAGAPAAPSSSGPSYPMAGAPVASSSKGPAYPMGGMKSLEGVNAGDAKLTSELAFKLDLQADDDDDGPMIIGNRFGTDTSAIMVSAKDFGETGDMPKQLTTMQTIRAQPELLGLVPIIISFLACLGLLAGLAFSKDCGCCTCAR